MTLPIPATPSGPVDGPRRVLDVGGTQVTLLGTAHVSRRSAEEVRETIERDAPDAVAIELDAGAGTASARSYYTVFQQTDELPLQPIISGHYHDSFHRVDGEWCFDTRQMFVDLTGDLSHHLLFELR